MVMIGKSSKENLLREGASTSSGRSAKIAFTLRCASFKAKSTSAPSFNCTIITDKLSYDDDSTFFTFSKDPTASSIFRVTDVSTSLGEAPG